MDRDESFIWQLEEASAKPDMSSAGDTSVVAPDTSDTSKTDTLKTTVFRTHDIQLQAVPKRAFDLMGRNAEARQRARRNPYPVYFK